MRPNRIALMGLAFIVLGDAAGGRYLSSQEAAEPHDRGWPIARQDRPLPSNPQQRALRQKRNQRFNAGGAKLTDGRGDVIVSVCVARPRLPVDNSDLILIGRVIGGEAFLSEDEAAVYSEFVVRVEEVLRPRPRSGVEAGSLVTAIRVGGVLELTSGKIIRLETSDGLPQLAGKYLLFLNYDKRLDAYRIVSGYRLQAGQAQTLDGPRGVFLDTGKPARPGPEPADALLSELRGLIESKPARRR
jgi:hypothetical protein